LEEFWNTSLDQTAAHPWRTTIFRVLAEIQGQFKFQLFMGVLPLESGVGLLAAFDTKTKGKSGCSAFSVHESL
jgi:hypothetical protein